MKRSLKLIGARRQAAALFAGMVSSVLLTLIPKCPVCFAAYLAVLTGVGISASVAGYARDAVIVSCALVLAVLFAKSVCHIKRSFSHE